MDETNSDQQLALQKVIETLTPKEAHALRFVRKSKQPEIALVKSAEMFELYQAGKDCEDIRKINPGFSLGQIVNARIRDDWDLKRQEHQQKLMQDAVPQILQSQVEAGLFLSDMLLATLKLNWEPIQRYLQSGDTNHLKGTSLEKGASLKQIRDIIDTLQAVTGQDKKKVIEHRGGVNLSSNRLIDTAEAAEILDVLSVIPSK